MCDPFETNAALFDVDSLHLSSFVVKVALINRQLQRLTGRHGEYDPDWARKFIISEFAKRLCGLQEEAGEGTSQRE